MPAICKPSPELTGVNHDITVSSARGLLDFDPNPEKRLVLQNELSRQHPDSSLIPNSKGLVGGIIRAFQQDLHLRLRPDDVWLAIVTQFSFFVNGHAEELRQHLVAHEGKTLVMIDIRPFHLHDFSMGSLAQMLADEAKKKVVDPELREWISPDFSTTTAHDRDMSGMVMLGAMQKYFDYGIQEGCGFPSVTLEGEKSDWEKLLSRLDRLSRYGEQSTHWGLLLSAVVRRMIATFERPDDQDIKDFWLRVAHVRGPLSSGDFERTLDGWITAFCYWDKDGNRIREAPNDLKGQTEELVYDGVTFPQILRKNLPVALFSVPVGIYHGGKEPAYYITLKAGCVGMEGTKSGDGEGYDTVQPLHGWWMLEGKDEDFGW